MLFHFRWSSEEQLVYVVYKTVVGRNTLKYLMSGGIVESHWPHLKLV
jgi:hypothetical protein